jgi:hypothetical protein
MILDQFMTWLYTDADVYVEVQLKDRLIEGKIMTVLDALEDVCVADVYSIRVLWSYEEGEYSEQKFIFDIENMVIKDMIVFDSVVYKDALEYGR